MLMKLQDYVGRIHANQSGAVMLLLLAAFLILFMTAMVIFDAGRAAQDKMDVQIAADSAAFSHSAVKSRSMNMIVYANIIKRMVFSFLATYANAWAAIVIEMAARAAGCFRFIPNPVDCYEFGMGVPMVVSEGIEFFYTQDPNLMGIVNPSGDPRSEVELVALETYQQYMHSITPWWAYVEGASRAMGNGALMSGSWPPPGSVASKIKQKVSQYVGTVDWVLGSTFINIFPNFSNDVDALPIQRRDKDELWMDAIGPFKYTFDNGTFVAGVEYCLEYALSMEAIITGLQTYQTSYSHPDGWKTIFVGLQAVPAIGCLVAALAYNDDGYLDWKIKESLTDTPIIDFNVGTLDKWLKSTAALSIAYKPRAGRNDNAEGRRKFRFMGDRYEANLNAQLYKNEGYFAIARSEFVYKQPLDEIPFLSTISELPIISSRLGLQNNPDMWSPRWKAKNRPIILPAESFGSAVQYRNGTKKAGLDTVINDTIPLLALGSMVGLVPVGQSEPFTLSSGLNDLLYLYRVGKTFTPENLDGISK